jgi:hypothetical protein
MIRLIRDPIRPYRGHLRLSSRYQDAVIIERLVRAIVGSINFAPGSFDDRRELAIELGDDDIVERSPKIAHHDWKHSHPLDLSDEGRLEDLEHRVDDAAHKLALAVRRSAKKKPKK